VTCEPSAGRKPCGETPCRADTYRWEDNSNKEFGPDLIKPAFLLHGSVTLVFLPFYFSEEVKVRLPLCLIKHYAMKTYVGVEV
jgi:hypothetical protein